MPAGAAPECPEAEVAELKERLAEADAERAAGAWGQRLRRGHRARLGQREFRDRGEPGAGGAAPQHGRGQLLLQRGHHRRAEEEAEQMELWRLFTEISLFRSNSQTALRT